MPRQEVNKIGLVGATSYVVGAIIGSGIFISPQGILYHVGSVGLSLCIWVFCALITMLNAINYIELGTSIPESGSGFAYVNYVGWHPLAFSFLWLSSVLQSSCSGAVLFLTFGEYLVESLDPVTHMSPDEKKTVAKLFGFWLLLSLMFMNLFSLSKFASRVQIASMFAKISALLMIIVIGFIWLVFKGDTQHFAKDYIFKGSKWNAGGIALAIYQGNWAYGGYGTLNFGAEDIQLKNFKKTLPRAMIGGLAICSVIYVLANCAYFVVLSPEEMLKSPAVATTFASATVGNFAYAMPALVGILIIGTLNADVFGWSRYMLAGARRGMMPTAWSLVHPTNDSPRVAIISHSILCICFSFVGNIGQLLNYVIVVSIMATLVSLLALIWIKWRKLPVSKHAVKFSIFWPILNWFVNLALFVVPFTQDPTTAIVGLGLYAIGLISYFIFIWPPRKPRFMLWLDEKTTYICQMAFWTVVDAGPRFSYDDDDNEKPPKYEFETEHKEKAPVFISSSRDTISSEDSNSTVFFRF